MNFCDYFSYFIILQNKKISSFTLININTMLHDLFIDNIQW